MKKGFSHFTFNTSGTPIEIKKFKKNNFLNNDVTFGQVKKINNKSIKPDYLGK